MIHFKCPSCEKSVKAKDRAAGTNVKCPACSQTIQIPFVASLENEQPPSNSAFPSNTANDMRHEEAVASESRCLPDVSTASAKVSIVGATENTSCERATRRVSPLAVAIIVFAGVGILFNLGLALWRVDLVISGEHEDINYVIEEYRGAYPAAHREGAMRGYILFQLVVAVVTACAYMVAIFGAIRMKQLRNWRLSFAAALICFIPNGAVCIAGIGIGIWGITTLLSPDVRGNFDA